MPTLPQSIITELCFVFIIAKTDFTMNLASTTLAILTLFYLLTLVSNEIFTSTFQIAELLKVERALLQELQVFIDVESVRLDKLRYYSRRRKSHRDNRQLNLENLNLNPVEVFTSSRKFQQSLKEVELLFKKKEHNNGELKVVDVSFCQHYS